MSFIVKLENQFCSVRITNTREHPQSPEMADQAGSPEQHRPLYRCFRFATDEAPPDERPFHPLKDRRWQEGSTYETCEPHCTERGACLEPCRVSFPSAPEPEKKMKWQLQREEYR